MKQETLTELLVQLIVLARLAELNFEAALVDAHHEAEEP